MSKDKKKLQDNRVPIGKLHKSTSLSNWYFHRDNLAKLGKWLPKIFVSDIRV